MLVDEKSQGWSLIKNTNFWMTLLLVLLFLPLGSRADHFGFEALAQGVVFPLDCCSAGGSPGAFNSDNRTYGGTRFEVDYFFGEKHGFLLGAAYARHHIEYIDCRTPSCIRYKSETKYPALVAGYYYLPTKNFRIWTALSLGYGPFTFRDHAESLDVHRDDRFAADLGVKIAYLIKLGKVDVALVHGVGFLRQYTNFSYNGADFGNEKINEQVYFKLGLGFGFQSRVSVPAH